MDQPEPQPAPKKSTWRRKLAIAFGIFALIVGVFAIVVALQPSEFTVTRSATMNAPPEEVFAQVNDFHAWQHWSPWAKLDPNSKATFEGQSSGEGAIFRWAGNSEIGEGSMQITESRPHERIVMQLAFLKPFPASNITEFTFVPEGDGTRMTWTMSGHNNFIGRAVCLFMDMDEMVGGQFEQGLANIRAIVEAEPKS